MIKRKNKDFKFSNLEKGDKILLFLKKFLNEVTLISFILLFLFIIEHYLNG